jgi:HAMP domain-containing protein
MKIQRKVAYGFAIIMALLIIGAGITIFQFVQLSVKNRGAMVQNKNYNDAMIKVHEALDLYDFAILSIMTDTSGKAIHTIEKADSLYTYFVQVSDGLELDGGERKLLEKFKNDFMRFRKDWITSLIHSPNIKIYLSSKEKEFRILKTALNRMMLEFQRKILDNSDKLFEDYKRALTPAIVTIITSLLLILIFNLLFSKFYIKPLGAIADALKKFHYKKTFKVEIETKDELGQLAQSIDELTKLIKK